LARAGRRNDKDVARAALLDRDMDHPVVTWGQGHRYGRPGDTHARIDRSHIRAHEAAAALRLVDGSDTAFAERGDRVRIGPLDILDDDAHVSPSAGSKVSTTCGKTAS